MDNSFFLGANSFHGFYSLYESYLHSLIPHRLFVLKGGAGCGKSGFMKRIGKRMAEAGNETQRILCSGDPDSLDGLYIPSLSTIFLDGTAPHVLEPALVGQSGFYIDLSRFYKQEATDLMTYDAAYREHYRKAYSLLGAAGKLDSMFPVPEETHKSIKKRADSLLKREIKRLKKSEGHDTGLFTDAFTWKGIVSLQETRRNICPRMISISGSEQEIHLFLSRFRSGALAFGYQTISGYNPLQPDRLSHMLLPEIGLGLTAETGERIIHLERLTHSDKNRSEQVSRKKVRSLQEQLMQCAMSELALAHKDHDCLEEKVNPLIDFDSVYQLADRYAQRLLDYAAASSM